MRILDWYIARSFIKLFFATLALFILLYIIGDVFGWARRLIEQKVGFWLAVAYFTSKIPSIIVEIVPFATLMGVLFSLYGFAKNNEILAMLTSGISLYRIFLPLFVFAFLISLAVFEFNEKIVPLTSAKTLYLEEVKIFKCAPEPEIGRYNLTLTTRDGRRVFIRFYDTRARLMEEVSVFELAKSHKLKTRIDAEQVKWEGNSWYFYNGRVLKFGETGVEFEEKFQRRRISLNEPPEFFSRKQKEPAQMNYAELKAYIKRLRSGGVDVSPLLVDLYAKFSWPFANFIIIFLGIPFVRMSSRTGGVATGFAISVLSYIIYWEFTSIAQILGRGGLLPPFWSAWIVNFLFLGGGVYILIRVRK
jgi:lipopolysaccharide export system permease protein